MFIINYLLDQNNTELSPAEAIEIKRKKFGISDDLIIKKFAFGFFADRCESEEAKSLSQYEWFIGSLSARCLRGQLSAFLKSKKAKQLHPKTRKQLESFIQISEDSKDQGFITDLARSKSISLLFLAKTGSKALMKLGCKPAKEEVDRLTDLTIRKIESLENGEMAFFTGGSLVHEIQIVVHHLEDGSWEVCICDTAEDPLVVYRPNEKILFSQNFWQLLYSKKLNVDFDNTTEDSLNLLGEKVSNARVRAATLGKQKKATCHIKCHLAVLKSFIVYYSSLPTEDALLEWIQFKRLFGAFFLKTNKLDDKKLKKVCKVYHKQHKYAFKRAEIFHFYVKQNEYAEMREAYLKAFEICGVHIEKQESSNKTANLAQLHNRLYNLLNSYPMTPDELKPFFNDIDNLAVKRTFDLFRRYFSSKQEEKKAAFEKALQITSTSLDVNADLQRYLEIFEENPHLASLHPSIFKKICLMAIQRGEIARVEITLAQLPLENLDDYIPIGFPLFRPALPESLSTYSLSHLQSPVVQRILPHLIKKALEEHDFAFLLAVNNIKSQRNFLNMEFSREKIDEVMELFSRQSHPKRFPLYNKVMLAIALSLINNKDHETFCRIAARYHLPPADMSEDFFEAPQLSATEALKWKMLAQEYPSSPLSALVNNIIIWSLYKHGLLKKGEDLECTSISNRNKFHHAYEEKDLELGFAILEEYKINEEFTTLILIDLLKAVSLYNLPEMFLRILESSAANHLDLFMLCSKGIINDKDLRFISKILVKANKEKWHALIEDCIQCLLLRKSHENYLLANELTEYLYSRNQTIIISHPSLEIKSSYQHMFPNSRLGHIFTRGILINGLKRCKNKQDYHKHFSNLVQHYSKFFSHLPSRHFSALPIQLG